MSGKGMLRRKGSRLPSHLTQALRELLKVLRQDSQATWIFRQCSGLSLYIEEAGTP
jgi:hypothetical protein